MGLAGTWIVISSPDFDDGYMHMEREPFVHIEHKGGYTRGTYHIGLQTGELYSKSDASDHLHFTFEGNDEMDMVHGAATAELQGDRMLFTLVYHLGDEFTFLCERQA
jgi:hypothetical protein